MATGGCAQADQARQATVQNAIPKTLEAKIAAAKPGETILLAAGDYGGLSIYRRKFAAPGIVIEPAPGATPTFSEIEISESEGVTIKGVDVTVTSAQYGVNVGASSRITLAGLTIHAASNVAPSAMMLREDHDVTVEDCNIHDIGFGINMLESDHLKIYRNTFKDLKVDAVRGAASNVEVIGNRATSFHPTEGDHPDFIQFWGQKGGASRSNLIKDNVYERGNGGVVQGIFVADNEDVVITGNALLGTMYNGITVGGVHGALIEDNFLQGYDDMDTRIMTRDESSDVIIRNNVAQSIVNYAEGGKPNPRYKEEHNRSIRSAKAGVTKDLEAWLANRPTPKTP